MAGAEGAEIIFQQVDGPFAVRPSPPISGGEPDEWPLKGHQGWTAVGARSAHASTSSARTDLVAGTEKRGHDIGAEHPAGTKVRLDLAYHGSAFSGFQVQPDKLTVQGALEGALATLLAEPVVIYGAGRTDAGVHAKHMVCHFTLPRAFILGDLLRALNALTPKELLIFDAREVPWEFHARYSPHRKFYRYGFDTGRHPDPFDLELRYHAPGPPPDDAVMQGVLLGISGTHDFASFTTSKNSSRTTVRTLEARLEREDERRFAIVLVGNGFLHNMVRIIAGSVLSAGRGTLRPAVIFGALDRPDARGELGETLPAHGLCLERIEYF